MTALTPDVQELFLQRALKAADWFVNSQLGSHRPDWNADRGRFMYYYYMPEKKHVPGLNWTMGRALFVLSEAYKLTGNATYRESAELGAAYIAALQVMDPHFKKAVGCIKESIPQTNWTSVLDAAQAASGLLMLHAVTGDERYARRAKAFGDFLLRNNKPEKGGLPSRIEYEPEEKILYIHADVTMHHCSAMPLWHLYRLTNDAAYLSPVIAAADFVLARQREDGALYYRTDPQAAGIPKINHHEGRGEGDDVYVLRNDDAIMVVVLAAYEATQEPRYIEAAVRYARWIMNNAPTERPYCAFPVQANNVLDIGKASGNDWSDWVMKHLDLHLLDRQVLGGDDPVAEGGFRGEDEEDEGGIFGGTSLDYVTTRMTCYSAGTLLRLSGKGTGAGFSVQGLADR